MTIGEAIERVDKLRPNSYTVPEKVAWLNQVDGQIFREIIQTHINYAKFERYTDETKQSTVLLVPYPYDEDIYIPYLKAKIALENGETGKYNQDIQLFNDAFQRYANNYNRRHMPIQLRRFIF